MTRLVYNAFKALWLPQSTKDDYIAKLNCYAVVNGVDWQNVARSKSLAGRDSRDWAARMSTHA